MGLSLLYTLFARVYPVAGRDGREVGREHAEVERSGQVQLGSQWMWFSGRYVDYAVFIAGVYPRRRLGVASEGGKQDCSSWTRMEIASTSTLLRIKDRPPALGSTPQPQHLHQTPPLCYPPR